MFQIVFHKWDIDGGSFCAYTDLLLSLARLRISRNRMKRGALEKCTNIVNPFRSQMILSSKSLMTEFTFEWFLSSVHSDMSL